MKWVAALLAVLLAGCLAPEFEAPLEGEGGPQPPADGAPSSLAGWSYGLDVAWSSDLPSRPAEPAMIQRLADSLLQAAADAGCPTTPPEDPSHALVVLEDQLRACAAPERASVNHRLAEAIGHGRLADAYQAWRGEAQTEARALTNLLNGTDAGSIPELEALAWLWREAQGVAFRAFLEEPRNVDWFVAQPEDEQWRIIYGYTQDPVYSRLLQAVAQALPAEGGCVPPRGLMAEVAAQVEQAHDVSTRLAVAYGLGPGFTWEDREEQPWFLEMAKLMGGEVPAAVAGAKAGWRIGFWDAIDDGFVPDREQAKGLIEAYWEAVPGFWSHQILAGAFEGVTSSDRPFENWWPEGEEAPPEVLVELAALPALRPPFADWDCTG